MEATKSSDEVGHSEQIISFKDDEKHLPSEMTQRGQSSGLENKIRLAERSKAPIVSPSPFLESQVFASVKTFTSKSRDQHNIHLRKKSIPLPNKRYLQSEYKLLSGGLQKKDKKSIKAGKYVCQYCGRACAKPSVLKKHIRSHTGERPYPCIPCGFSFKTMSNLYKHRKSHTHAVKAGLVSCSKSKSRHVNDEAEGEMHSDVERTSDTDEEALDILASDSKNATERTGFVVKKEDRFSAQSSGKKKIGPSGKVSLWQFREMMAPDTIAQVDQMIEFSSVKHKLALRLSEKKSQESDQSLSLPSSYSKGSTDSGYFSRSESAEQQFGQSSSSAKSYQEIMFGKCYRPAARPKQSITVQTCMIDINEATSSFMVKPNKGLVAGETESIYKSKKNLVQATKMDSESFLEEDFQECQNPSYDPLETTSDGGVFLRSNSLPTSSNPSVNEPQVLRMSNSFDERIAGTDVSYRSAMGMKRLMRQSAFEHCANEGHGESDCYIHLACSLKSELKIQSIDKSEICAENSNETESSFVSSNQSSEILTRKRRKGNTVEEGPGLTQDISSNISGTSEEHKIKENISDERRSGSNVISVIQHTNSVSRLTSAEKSCDGTSVEKEHSMQETGPDWQWGPGSFLQQKLHMQKQLVAQSSIQVPEIRVTVEPDMPEKSLDPIVKQREKHSEEFQWPQRSETLSQFPVEKLPPKKKRLRLAEMECSSGESSFESACTSLSRSPSQDSNLSHSSSFSQSLDREETLHLASQSLPDESNRPLEFLSVPGRSQNHHREMRRCASEQAPHKLPSEIPEFRSKSFDYGSLYFSTSKLEDIKERRKAFLVRQESLSGEPEMLVGLVSDEMSKRTTSPNKLFMIEGSMKYSSAGPSTHLKLQYVQPSFCNVKEMDNIMLGIKNEPEEVKTSEPHIHLRKHQEEWSQSLGNVLSTISMLSQSQQAFASQTSTGFLVPVRIQMQVPNYGNTTYTSISHILDSHRQKPLPCIELKKSSSQNLPVILPQTNLRCDPIISGQPIQILCSTQASPAKLNTGIPLSLTSKTISTTEAPSGGANKRMLSPASSIEFFIEAKQQKRIKDENIYGQIVEELGAVELENLKHDKEFPEKSFRSESTPKTCDPSDEHMDEPMQDIYTNSELQMLEQKPTPEDLIVAQHSSSSVGMVPSALPGAILFSKFPGLHTTTCVSWCYLNSIKPSSSLAAAPFSEYASWFVRCHNPNPPDQSTGKVLGLLRSKQQSQNAVYSVATMYQPGLLVTSMPWRLKQEQTTLDHRTEALKQDVKQKDSSQEEKPFIEDVATTLCQAEPVRVKIFEGGYKSNEDYIYVRGRGRGKYICEECGIRCKKPSMLKKHIRTHTDVRPYICKCCNFAFKTKGNLTKHMKSKAHMKKCLELGVSPLATDNTEDGDDIQMLGNVPVETTSKHQFSDAEDSDGVDEDEPDDDEEDDECDGDSTPRTLSRSTSPQSYAVTKPYRSSSHSKDSLNQQLEVSSIGSEDDLNFDQSSSSFEVYPPQLLSPCWDSPCQRYMSPSGDVSPCQQFSSRDSSPLRAISPRRDLSIRGDFSPVRQLSPARPKGSDTSGQRTQSPLGRQKVVLRAMSPRRGSYQQRTHMDPGRSVRFQASPIRPIIREHKVDGDNPSNLCIPTGLCNRKDLPKTLQLDMFSHLPLHSQGKIPTPVPMVPIGGLRMPAISTYSVAAVGNSSLSVTEENISSPVLNPEFVCSGKTAANFTELPGKDVKKEENIYICAKAIASLRITSEGATHKPPNC